ncbi:hypothetical protein CEK26_002917 [Fusarium fujikuroi]|nr:hypothetical protein CEK27_002911 [Fusarium fujikuroi]QGJ01473.1 hypothetical protein CEK26_002917 [Fusarium fujikuroi]VTT61572.1 unnamed protein product [Fusarium fujikuroi]VTT76814.1 unnamed protein product [Fusarium fujikuroi]
MDPVRPRSRDEFKVALICALPLEANSVLSLFDHHWDEDDGNPRIGKARGDPNSYSIGIMSGHRVVLAHPPGIGIIAAGTIAAFCKLSFTSIRLALVIGICGGAPVNNGIQIHLGDVIISTGIVSYDFGRRFSDRFEMKDTSSEVPGRPNLEIRGLLSKLATTRQTGRLRSAIYSILYQLHQGSDTALQYPGTSKDILFPANYRHKHHEPSKCAICAVCRAKSDPVCAAATVSDCHDLKCNTRKQLSRPRLTGSHQLFPSPNVHFGIFASGNSVIKSGEERDRLNEDKNAIGFEMESAGVWDIFPCIVIKGVCDYADSHKNKEWQQFASASAAACARVFLGYWNFDKEDIQGAPIELPALPWHPEVISRSNSFTQAPSEPPSGSIGSQTYLRGTNGYSIPRDDIDLEVISDDFSSYLGDDAIARPGQFNANRLKDIGPLDIQPW